jgi:thioredoxin 1
MADKLTTYTDGNWDKDVLGSDTPVLVDFWAEWCVPCVIMAPALNWASAHFRGRLKVGRLNVDENPGIAARYRVVGLPTVMVVEDGREAERRVGLMDSSALVKLFARHVRGLSRSP